MVVYLYLFKHDREAKAEMIKNLELEVSNLKGENSKEAARRRVDNKFKDNQMTKLKDKYVKEITDLKLDHQKEISDLNKGFNDKVNSTEFLDSILSKVTDNVKENHFRIKEEISKSEEKLSDLKSLIKLFNEETELIENGVYQPKYQFSNAFQYEEKLNDIREQ